MWVPPSRLVYFLFVYSKQEAGTLTRDQKKALAVVVRAIKRELAGKGPGKQG